MVSVQSNGSSQTNDTPKKIDELRSMLKKELDARVAPGTRVAFLGFPYDTNVGNHMMWLGFMNYMAERGAEVVYAAHVDAYRAESMRREIGSGLIVFIGGVGLSTLWMHQTEIKRRVAREFPDNPLLVLPSTVAYRSPDEQNGVRDLFGSHKNTTVLARDEASWATVKDTFEGVTALCTPDGAWLLPVQARARPPEHDIIWLARSDHEGTGYAHPQGVYIFDWAARTLYSSKDYPASYVRMRLAGLATRARNAARVPRGLERRANRVVADMYQAVSAGMLDSGNADLDRGKVLVTDRFHPHVLAILRGQPVVLLNDAYSKNATSYESWTNRFPNVVLVRSSKDALEAARRLAESA